jgi:hypothetical protein
MDVLDFFCKFTLPKLTKMKYLKLFFVALFVISTLSCEEETALTDEQIVAGLKEALRVGTENSVASANQTDGYFANLAIKILFPEDAAFVKTALDAIGLSTITDELVLKLNRAAEDAADEAKPIFLDAITNMTILDALTILNGSNEAATQYLRANTYEQLKAAFKPDIENSLNSVGASQAWTTVTDAYNLVPGHQPVNTDLADYTTGKALDGLFILVAKEEEKIRLDPAARINEILQQVFGSL